MIFGGSDDKGSYACFDDAHRCCPSPQRPWFFWLRPDGPCVRTSFSKVAGSGKDRDGSPRENSVELGWNNAFSSWRIVGDGLDGGRRLSISQNTEQSNYTSSPSNGGGTLVVFYEG